MLNDVSKYLDDNNEYCTNQQWFGHKCLFRGVIAKEWVMGNHNVSNFHACNKVLVKICTHFYHKCWKRKCAVLLNPEVQQNVLKE